LEEFVFLGSEFLFLGEKEKDMLRKSILLISLGTFIALYLSFSEVLAQSNPIYVPLPGGVKAALYKPDSGPAPHVAVLTVHRVSNKLSALE
jgi:hypothetical protein